MYTTKVNVNDLVIDMPLDEANVTQKMESLKAGGLVQPVTVWLQDFRIIDGFHRTEAAKRLGWTEIDCVVKDCDEGTFWDARIQSARQHHRITNDRFLAWMLEAWQTTEWKEFGFDETIKTELWNVQKEEKLRNPQSALHEWLILKSKMWDIDIFKLYDMLMWKNKPNLSGLHKAELESAAAKANLNHLQRDVFVNNTPAAGTGYSRPKATPEEVQDYAFHVASASKPQKFSVFRESRDEKIRQRVLDDLLSRPKKSKSEIEREMRDGLRRDLISAMNTLKANIKQNPDVFTQLNDGYEMLMSLSAWAATKAAELFPEREQPTEVQLRRELADAYRQIESLQKALDSRKEYRQRLPEVLAYSSTEISKAN